MNKGFTNYNKPYICFCQYCGKECKSLNSLKSHECRCQQNPNRITINRKRSGFARGTRMWVNNKIENKSISIKDLELYLSNGWTKGLNDKFRENLSKSLIGLSTGRASSPEKEEERKRKISQSMKGNTNWKFNKRHGNSKQGWYNGIHCDSTWELAFLVYYKEHNLYIKRCKLQLDFQWNGEIHKYIPDFETEEGIIEIKGRKDKKAIEKEKQFPDIKVIDSNLIKPYLEYVINKYGINFWEQLYENG